MISSTAHRHHARDVISTRLHSSSVVSVREGSLGAPLREAAVEGFALSEVRYAPNVRLAPHSHERACIGVILEGTIGEVLGGREVSYSPVSVVFKPEGIVHANHASRSGARCLFIEVQPSRLAMIRTFSGVFERCSRSQDSTLAGLGVRIAGELREMDASAPLAIEGLILELLAGASRRTRRAGRAGAPHWLREARDILHDSFRSAPSLGALAGSVGVHPAHLARTFRERYHCSVGEYVRRLKLDHAARELSRSDVSIAEVALAAGFYDQSHFSNTFKRHTGVTPAAFRAASRGAKRVQPGRDFPRRHS